MEKFVIKAGRGSIARVCYWGNGGGRMCFNVGFGGDVAPKLID